MNMGNLGFPSTILNVTNQEVNSSENSNSSSSSSNSEDDSSLSSADEAETTLDSNIKFVTKSPSYFEITIDNVKNIETDLDFYEIISIIFLMYDTNFALQVIRSMIAAGPEHFSRNKLSEWACRDPKNWKVMLLEALAIIQNYKVLGSLGYTKQNIDVWLQPRRDATLYLSRPKKMLYLVCDSLNREQAKKLIELIRSDAKFEGDITLNCDPIYIEFHVLFWISRKYICIDGEISLKNLTKHLKVMDFLDKVEEIDMMVQSINNGRKKEYANLGNERNKKGCAKLINESNKKELERGIELEDSYTIQDPNNVGLLIIINMAEFKIDKGKKNQHGSRDKRLGTQADVDNLTKTFTQINFKVVTKHDIFDNDFESEIHNAVIEHFEHTHSVLVLCVLSHGDKGVVYAANSIPVRIESIRKSVSGSSRLNYLLAGKPKIIIIEACQGQKRLRVDPEPQLCMPDSPRADSLLCLDGSDLQCDGLENLHPKDDLVCMATIEGCVAIRSTTYGTKYIQELCRCIRKYHRSKHFYEIVTAVHKTLNSEKMHIQNEGEIFCHEHKSYCDVVYMTPEIKNCTLRNLLYLTQDVQAYK